ncbi:MAG: chemotaxis protein CheA [Desulfobacteraceae bacterium]|nr:chemotaxis protein CheA [Desulfobacteraceae bacterium]
MLTTLEEIETISSQLNAATLLRVTRAYISHVKRMISGETRSTIPLEQGLPLIKALYRHIERGTAFPFDISDVMEVLDDSIFEEESVTDPTPVETQAHQVAEEIRGTEEPQAAGEPPAAEPTGETEEPQETEEPGAAEAPQVTEALQETEEETTAPAAAALNDEDLEILTDFIAEAEENLETIEIDLVELEQAPSDMEIINNIFRPFHTIKGVSGFLDLKKINSLAHCTETLLDHARSGDFLVNDIATDAILESVDTLKRLLARIRAGLAKRLRGVDDDIDIDPLKKKLQALPQQLIEGDREPIGEILVKRGVIDRETLEETLEEQDRNSDKKIGEILVNKKKVDSKEVASALMEQRPGKKPVVTAQVKVNTNKLDDLVDFAGELVIAQSMLKQRSSHDSGLTQNLGQLGQIVTNIQNIAMSMRMIPIKATFMKMIRLVRDLSRKSNKDVTLEMSGEETEIDRNVVDALYEPMVHMIRNSVDHGIERSEDRMAKGKQAKGTIFLRAFHKGGNIVIEIEDDGKGLDKDSILEKATATGLVTQGAKLTDQQIFNLILQPGFSTAKTITDVSGRGVGMDVVKDGIEKFRGHLSIDSTPGKGTKFTISLPLTLAIIDGMLVKVGTEKFVIPTIAIQRSFRPEQKECYTVEKKGEMIKDRDSLIPLIRMKSVCGIKEDSKKPWESLVVVVESKGEARGLLIDELLGKDEYVIKSLGANLEEIQGFSGGAILADGRVGLILDMYGLFEIASA